MTGEILICETAANGIARLTLNRPEARNALDGELIARLTEALRRVEQDPAVIAVVIAGSGKHFSAGADLKTMGRLAAASLEENIEDVSGLAELMHTLDRLGKPTVSLIQGAAVGAGFGLAAASDLVIAAEDAVFALPEVKLGIIPGIISPYVIAAIGPRQARRYFITGERFSAAEARRIGLVHEVAPAERLDAALGQVTGQLLENGPISMAQSKDLIFSFAGRQLDQGVIGETVERVAKIRISQECREGVGAFLEKRKPVWQRE